MESKESLDILFDIKEYHHRPVRMFIIAVVLPFLFPVLAYLLMSIFHYFFRNSFSANDWLGIGIILFGGISLALLCFISFLLCIISIKRKEKFFPLTVCWAILNLFFIINCIAILLS